MIRKIGIHCVKNKKLTCPFYRMSSSNTASDISGQSERESMEGNNVSSQPASHETVKLPQEMFFQYVPNEIVFEEHVNCGLISLNRPKVLNSLTYSMVGQVVTKLEKWKKEKRFVIVEGLGGKAFSAGGDLSIVTSCFPHEFPNISKKFFTNIYRMGYTIYKYKLPFIALMDNITMGAATSLSLTAKYRIVTERSVYGMPEVSIGFYPDAGSSYFLSRLPNYIGYYIGLTAVTLKGIDLLRVGIGTHYVPSERLPDLKNDLLASKADDIEVILHKYQPKDTLNTEFSLTPHLDQITKCFSAPTVEEIISRLENDGSQWAKKTVKRILGSCPLSVKLTHLILQKGEQLNLHECFKMEYNVSIQFVQNPHDFREGVAAKLVGKHSNPVWKQKHIRDVSEEHLMSLFDHRYDLQLDAHL